jgi:hypothetical protein
MKLGFIFYDDSNSVINSIVPQIAIRNPAMARKAKYDPKAIVEQANKPTIIRANNHLILVDLSIFSPLLLLFMNSQFYP